MADAQYSFCEVNSRVCLTDPPYFPPKRIHKLDWQLTGLLSLLRSSLLSCLAEIGSIMSFLRKTFECLPGLANGRGDFLTIGDSITSRSKMANHALNESALTDSRTQEDRIDQSQNPAASLEQ